MGVIRRKSTHVTVASTRATIATGQYLLQFPSPTPTTCQTETAPAQDDSFLWIFFSYFLRNQVLL